MGNRLSPAKVGAGENKPASGPEAEDTENVSRRGDSNDPPFAEDTRIDDNSPTVSKNDLEKKKQEEELEGSKTASTKSNEDSDGEGDDGGPENKDTKASKPKSTLDNTTLEIIKNYLTQGITQDVLEEEEVTMNAVKTSRYANERTRYRQNVLEDLEGEAETFYARVYRQEESYAIANDFFKSVTDESQQQYMESMEGDAEEFQMDKRTLNWLKKAAGLVRPYDPLDGQQQPYLSEEDDLEGDADESGADNKSSAAAPRRMTRGLARSTRVKRREERIRIETQGLTALVEAIGDLESERGPFEAPKREVKRPPKHIELVSSSSDSEEMDSNLEENNKKVGFGRDPPLHHRDSGSVLTAKIPSKAVNREGSAKSSSLRVAGVGEMKLTRVLVDGKHIEGMQKGKKQHQQEQRKLLLSPQKEHEKERGNKRKSSGENRTYMAPPSSSSKKKRRMPHGHVDDDQSSHEGSVITKDKDNDFLQGLLFRELDIQSIFHPRLRSRDSTPDPLSLDMLDWRRRRMLQRIAKKKSKKPGRKEEAPYKPPGIIPEIFIQDGLLQRLPPREVLRPVSKSFTSEEPSHFDPPRRRHTDDVYATLVKKLMNSLSSGGKRWAHHEFFYSDIDRGWYESSDFVSDVAKMGILPSTRLTRREWSLVRRHIPKRPRRFSRRFIFQELKKRNRYRNIVRQLQRNPEQPNPLGRAVPSPIRVGTTVTAYNKRLGILHRGVVLFHDTHSHGYLVQFERKELGFEFCPDSEVASHGVPEILVPPTDHHLHGSSQVENHISEVGTIQYGTRRGPGGVVHHQRTLAARAEVAAWLGVKRDGVASESNRRHPWELIEQVAERETLVLLMATIKSASKRKSMILKTLEHFNEFVSEFSHTIGFRRRDIEQHYAWLISNLQITNHALDTALLYMQTMYGKAYSKTPNVVKEEEEGQNTLAMENSIRECCRVAGGPPSHSVPWATTLVLDSRDVGNALAARLLGEEWDSYDGDETEPIPLLTENQDILQRRLGAAASLLFTTTYCCESASSKEGMSSVYGMETSLNAGLSAVLKPFESMSASDPDNLSGRIEAVNELKGALDLLKAELALAGAKQSFQEEGRVF